MRVDLSFDPVCPYSWIAHRWLAEVAKSRDIDVHFHVISLVMLNEKRDVSAAYRRLVERSSLPARVFAAVVQYAGEGALGGLYESFGVRNFDRFRHPQPTELRATLEVALAENGLPQNLLIIAESKATEDALRVSHTAATESVGSEAGTPILAFDGAPIFGPVLNSIPRGQQALELFDAAVHLARFPDFCELKRTRTTVPAL